MGLEDRLADGPPAPSRETLGKLAALLDRQGISVDEIGKIQRVSVYQSLTKNEDGEAEIHDLLGVQFSPAWESGPEWETVRQGPPTKVTVRLPKPLPRPEGYEVAVVLPDMQIGYFRGADGDLEPTHDEAAITVAEQIIAAAQPDKIVLVGDNLDAPEFGRYRLSPAFSLTTQASIDRATELCFRLRALAPEAEICWIAGNHEERISNATLDNLKAAFGIKRGLAPDSLPVLSVPFLLRMDEAQIDYRPGYPAGSYWINERLRVIHGDKVASGEAPPTSTLPTARPASSTVTSTDANGRNVAVKISMGQRQSWRHHLAVLRGVMAAFRLRKAASTWTGDRYR